MTLAVMTLAAVTLAVMTLAVVTLAVVTLAAVTLAAMTLAVVISSCEKTVILLWVLVRTYVLLVQILHLFSLYILSSVSSNYTVFFSIMFSVAILIFTPS